MTKRDARRGRRPTVSHYRSDWLYFCYLLCFYFTLSESASEIISYNEPQVLSFLRGLDREKVSPECAVSLSRMENHLVNESMPATRRHLFIEAFSSGVAKQFLKRDQDRWFFNALKCLKSAGEASFSASGYPTDYCFGFNYDDSRSAYGICVPSACADNGHTIVKEWQAVVSKKYDNQLLDFGFCTPSRYKTQWYEQTVPLLHLSFDAILMGIVVLATVIHVKRGDSTKSLAGRLLLAFSLKTNVRKLFQMPKDADSTITCMFGLRFLAMAWTVIGHSFMFVQAFIENIDDFKNELVDNFRNQWITNFTMGVDVFFTLSGCLTAYIWFRKWQNNTTGTEVEPGWTSLGYWLRFYRHRLFRLWPAYIYTMVALTMRLSVTHYHPIWQPIDAALQCPKYWYQNILFINSINYNQCMPWTWYIGTEFIFYLLSPLFLLSLRRSPTIGVTVTAIVIGASTVANAAAIVVYNFPPVPMAWRQPAIFSEDYVTHHLVMYIKPWYRIGPYLVGMLLGYCLATDKSRILKSDPDSTSSRQSPNLVVVGWTMATVAGFWSVYGVYPSIQGWDFPIYHLLYGATYRTVFSVSLSWLIYACHFGYGGRVNRFLSAAPFLPLSTLSYSVYLIHLLPVFLTLLLSPFPIRYRTNWHIYRHCVIQLAISYCFGTICAMLAEMPALNIERLFLAGHQPLGYAPSPLIATSGSKHTIMNQNGHADEITVKSPLTVVESKGNDRSAAFSATNVITAQLY